MLDKSHFVLVESCTIAKCLIHFKNSNKTMAIVIQKILIKAFHNFMLFFSMVLLLTVKKTHETLTEQHAQESKVGSSC